MFDVPNKSARINNTSPDNKKLDIINKHLKMTKVNNNSSPFDRTKMNTLGTTNISKQSLGIRKKSLPKVPNLVVKHSDVKIDLNKSEIVTQAAGDIGDIGDISSYEDVSDCVGEALHNNTDQCNKTEDNSCCSENIEENQDQSLSCTLCGKLDNKSENVSDCENKERIETSPRNVELVEQNSCKSTDSIEMSGVHKGSVATDSTNVKEVQCDSNSSRGDRNLTKSALALVGDYSDTDSDT